MWGFGGWSDGVNKRICRFLIHRYLGHLLKEKISLEQLSVDLYNGTGRIHDVNVDVQFVNELLESLKAPVRLLDGYVGEITAEVPWASLLQDSCLMQVNRLEITLQPCPNGGLPAANMQPAELVASMIDSVVGSMASSMDLAKSFLSENGESVNGQKAQKDGQDEDNEADGVGGGGGVEAFAQIIDAMLSRMRLVFVDTVVRVENPLIDQQSQSELRTAVELQIDRMEFVDEQLEACQQQGSSLEPITTQPHSLYTIPDLNKILHLHGIRLYTDVFTRPDAADYPSSLGSSQVFTSMYVRRQEKARQQSNSNSNSVTPPSPVEPVEMVQSSLGASTFQSCYSHLSSAGPSNVFVGSEEDRSDKPIDQRLIDQLAHEMGKRSDDKRCAAKLLSDPVQIAAFSGERHTVRLRLRNTALSSAEHTNNKVDIQVFLGSMTVFLTPSQLKILTTALESIFVPSAGVDGSYAFGSFGGKPMQQLDFAKVEHQLQADMDSNAKWRTDFMAGNWAGEERFFDTSRKPGQPNSTQIGEMASVILDSDRDCSTGPASSVPLDKRPPQAHERHSTAAVGKPEVVHVKGRVSGIWMTITHRDPLGMLDSQTAVDAHSAVETVRAWSSQIFRPASGGHHVELTARTDLTSVRPDCDAAFTKDHLRLLACPVVVDYTLERFASNSETILVSVSAQSCQLLECLCPSSVQPLQDNGGALLTHVELLKFNQQATDTGGDGAWSTGEVLPNVTVRLTNKTGQTNFHLLIELSPCASELDPSIVDRIYNLTHCSPVFAGLPSAVQNLMANTYGGRTHAPSTGSMSSLELKEDLFGTAAGVSSKEEPSKSTIELDVRCAECTVDIRIPVADCRETSSDSRPPCYVRRVRDEFLRLRLENVRLKTPAFDTSTFAAYGQVQLTAGKANGWFIGDERLLRCPLDQRKFLFAQSTRDQVCSVLLKWDSRNRSLKGDGVDTPEAEMTASTWGSCFKLPTAVKEGPFSKKTVMHENEELTIVGTREEMSAFGQRCLRNSDIVLQIDLPLVRLLLPNKHFYELLYNRLVNDFALWEPCSPPYYRPPPSSQHPYDIHVRGLTDEPFLPCRSMAMHKDSDDESDAESGSTLHDRKGVGLTDARKAACSNKFSLLLNASSGRIMLGAHALENRLPVGCGELSGAVSDCQLFVVSAYKGDPNTVYFYTSVGAVQLWHQNIIFPSTTATGYCRDVSEANFSAARSGDRCAEPIADDFKRMTKLSDDDNFAVALHVSLNPKEHAKEILVAIGVRNTTLHARPFRDAGHFWITQLVDFFDVPDYPIDGYTMPKITTRLHVSATSSIAAYDHACVKPGSPMKLRLALGSCDVSSRIVQDFCVLKLRCLFEEAKLFVCGKPSTTVVPSRRVNFDDDQFSSEHQSHRATKNDYVCVMKMGLLDLEVTVAEELMSGDGNTPAELPCLMLSPLLEVTFRNDLIKLWTCADSLASLVNIGREIAESEIFLKPAVSEPSPEQSVSNSIIDANPSTTTANTPVPPAEDISLATKRQQQQLELMVRSAMLHTVGGQLNETTPSTNVMQSPRLSVDSTSSGGAARKIDLLASAIDDDIGDDAALDNDSQSLAPQHGDKRQPSTSCSDDDFCIVDEIPGSGIQLPTGEPRIRTLVDSRVEFVENHFSVSMRDRHDNSHLARLPANYPMPLIRYHIKDFSILLHLYGGADFAELVEQKTYSVLESRHGARGQRLESDAVGGINRDHSVLVEMQLTKICVLYEMFGGNAPALSRHLITVQDVEVRDRLSVSQINKLLYQYASGQRPRRTCAPMVAVRALETHNGEGRLKISLLPIRLNVDQDTLEFLQDFATETAARSRLAETAAKASGGSGNDPVLELPASSDHERDALSEVGSSRPSPPNNHGDDDINMAVSSSPYQPPSMDDSVSTLAEFFNQKEPESVDLFAVGSVSFPAEETTSHSPPMDAPPPCVATEESFSERRASSAASLNNATRMPSNSEIFFKSYSFSPAVTIRLDYQGKRVKTDQGTVLGLLIGLSQLHCTELHLKELHNRHGLLGVSRCVQYSLNEWLADIRRNQLPQVVGSYGPISSLVQIASGIRDLFVMPMDEYRKDDGRVIKGVQRGAESFGVSTATAAVELSQRVVTLIQGAAEFAFDIVTPEYPPPPSRRRALGHQGSSFDRPEGLRRGLDMAMETIKTGAYDTVTVLQEAMQEEQAQGRWPVRCLLRQFTPSVIRPIIVGARATDHLLEGLKGHFQPDTQREYHDKYRSTGGGGSAKK